MSMIGTRILEKQNSILPSIIEGFASIGSAQIGDCMERLYGINGLTAYHQCTKVIVGIAVTVKTRPGDNLLIHKAIAMAKPGDFIVVDGGGCIANALVGELMMMDAASKGVAGFVINGAIRDRDVFSQQEDFACYATSVSLRGPFKDGPGEINVPVAVGGQVICPGDILVADADGIIVVPSQWAENVLFDAQEKEKKEALIKEKLRMGTYQKPWVDQTLEQKYGIGK